MDLSDKDKFGLEKRSGDHMNYHNPGIPADWRFVNPQMGLVTPNTSIPICQDDQMDSSSSCPPVSMADSFGPGLWNQAANSQNLGMFLQNGAGILPQSLSQFPADSAFIERAARFSCFNGGNFSGMMNPFGMNTPMDPYSGGAQSQGEASKDVAIAAGSGSNGGSPVKARRDTEMVVQGTGVSGNESGEHEFGRVDMEAPNSENMSAEPSSKGLAPKKRRRGTQEMELDQAKGDTQPSVETSKENAEAKQNSKQNNSASKSSGKQGKDGADSPKEDYIHVRARRGQATNSHSLAERVRREKISERMKFLQDLVPGCSKVTGKAVMLDEIINYVQSLQRQVEFLSMKLAAVNPRLDFNIEGLLAKEILQSRPGSSSAIGFSADMSHHQLHPAQQGLIQSGIPGIGSPPDALRRAINAQLTATNAYKEPNPQMPNAWDVELHKVIQMGFGATGPLNIQELNGKPRDGFSM